MCYLFFTFQTLKPGGRERVCECLGHQAQECMLTTVTYRAIHCCPVAQGAKVDEDLHDKGLIDVKEHH